MDAILCCRRCNSATAAANLVRPKLKPAHTSSRGIEDALEAQGGNSRSRLRGLSAISVPWSGASKRMPPWQAKLESHKSPPAPSRSQFSCEIQIVRNCIYQTDSKTLRCGFLHKSHRACRTANFGANIDDGLLDECVNPACLFGSPRKLHRA